MSLIFQSFHGPASFPTKQNINNGNIKNVYRAMPAQFQYAGNSMFAIGRHLYTNSSTDAHTKRWAPISSGERTYLKKNISIGQGSIQSPATIQELSFRSQDSQTRNTRLQKCRSGGCVAPKKKGANREYKSGGYSRLTSIGNRQIFA